MASLSLCTAGLGRLSAPSLLLLCLLFGALVEVDGLLCYEYGPDRRKNIFSHF